MNGTTSSKGLIWLTALGLFACDPGTADEVDAPDLLFATQAPLALKLTATATASSSENAGLAAKNAVDGSSSTRWSSAFSDPQSLTLDLGSVKSIGRVVLSWEAAYSAAYDIQLSSDGKTFTTVYTDNAGNGGVDDLKITGSARYVRVYSRKRGTGYGVSLWEAEVYAPDTVTVDAGTPSADAGTRDASVVDASAPSAISLPAKLDATKPARFSDTTPTNLGSATCSSTALDAEPTGDTGGGCNVGWTDPGEWLEWDVSVASTGKFDLSARLASAATGKTVHLEVDGARVGSTLTAPSAGWQSFSDVTSAGVSLGAGNHKLRLVMDTGSTNVRSVQVSSAATPSTNLDSCKRGVAFGRNTVAGLTALSKKVTWWYNWSTAPESAVKSAYAGLGVEFVPMLWSAGSFSGANNIPAGSKTLLGFNEPNFFAQANMSAATSASRWPDVENVAASHGNLKIASPAVNYCGPASSCWDTDPFHYLSSFFSACTNCKVDYVAVHWYACDLPALQWYIGNVKSSFPGKPIWLTEFACGDGNDTSLAKQKQFMSAAIPWLESEPAVAKYSWFADGNAIPNVALTDASGALTELGQLYVSLASNSSCPK